MRTLARCGAMLTPNAVVKCIAPKSGAIKKLATPPKAPAVHGNKKVYWCMNLGEKLILLP